MTACESEEELARVLTASLRARLLKVQGCTGGCYITILPEGLVHVAQNTGRGLFDVTADDSAQLQKAYTDALLQAKRIMDALQFSGLQE